MLAWSNDLGATWTVSPWKLEQSPLLNLGVFDRLEPFQEESYIVAVGEYAQRRQAGIGERGNKFRLPILPQGRGLAS